MLACVLALLNSCSSPSSMDQVGQFNKDTTSIESYLLQNNIKATKFISQGSFVGWYIVDSAASGFRPNFVDTVSLTYSIKLIPSGAVVDNAATPVSIPLPQLVPLGVQLLLPEFQKGSKGRIFVPSFYGYGGTTSGNIPANSNLIVQFHLVDLKDHQLIQDTTAIGKYLKSEQITNYSIDPSGIRFVIINQGTGASPSLTDSVKVTYTTALIPSDQVVGQSSAAIEFLVSDLIEAWKIALPYIKVGGSMAIYAPSGLAYGPNSVPNIPVSSNLVFSIQLLSVKHN